MIFFKNTNTDKSSVNQNGQNINIYKMPDNLMRGNHVKSKRVLSREELALLNKKKTVSKPEQSPTIIKVELPRDQQPRERLAPLLTLFGFFFGGPSLQDRINNFFDF